MMFTEVLVPAGVFSREDRVRLARRLTVDGLYGGARATGASDGERADPGVLAFLETITHVVVREADVWVADGAVLDATTPPRYVVRVHVPGPWRKDLSAELVSRITKALAEFDPDPDRLYREPVAEVHVLGVPEGGYGAYGRVVGQSALADLISEARQGIDEVPEGVVVDPVCGMTVRLDRPDVVTAEVDGVVYGFCCTHCRGEYLARRRDASGMTS